MAAKIYPFGFVRAKEDKKADLYLINTCTVTHRADSSSRQAISKAARQNPEAKIVVAGCYVDKDPATVAGFNGVDVIIRNSEKTNIANILTGSLPDLFTAEPDKNCSTAVADFTGHNRAWLKVSDGCNQWCSFCIIPQVRGRLANRGPADIIDEVRGLVAHGFREIVLTGINVGHYSYRTGEPSINNLAELVQLILDETAIERLRISSIEPQTVREDLVRLYAAGDNRLCRHWHLPLQSGSSRMLRLMRRPYDQAAYIKRATAIKESRPNTIIGADVIVGFPGETDKDFAKTCKVAESGLIDYLHVFSYSDRSGTHSFDLLNKISPDIIKERNAILTRLSSRLRAQANQRQIGQTLSVIAEDKTQISGGQFGVADNYIRVAMPIGRHWGREIVSMRIRSAHDDHVEGELIG